MKRSLCITGYVRRGSNKFHLDADEAQRLCSRQDNMKIIKTLQDGLEEGEKRFAHFCYVKLLGIIPNFEQSSKETSKLKDRKSNHSQNNESTVSFGSEETVKNDSKISNQTLAIDLTNKHISLIRQDESNLSDTVLYEDCDELIERRAEYLVHEDDFTPKLADIVKRQHGTYTFKQLVNVCKRFEDKRAMKQHHRKTEEKHEYFLQYGLSADEAKACAFAIAFYTGSESEVINQETALIVRTTHGEAAVNGRNEEIGSDAAIIMFYLVRGLSYIKFYWGTVTRRVQLKKEELEDYKPGALITWIQFSSTTKAKVAPEIFQKRNTQFTIKSLTGRAIKEFSNFPEEDEVLLLPHSSFIVHKVEIIGDVNYISMEQVELGLCKYSILWVDDNIFDENWENKRHMEKASTAGVHFNVHFIPKSNTDSALAFLRSPFGKRLKDKETFRIVTDMNRYNESESHNAGARLLLNVRNMEFNCECLIFTSDARKANEQLEKVFPKQTNRKFIQITTDVNDLENFVTFHDRLIPANKSDKCRLS